jgi:RND family efflux transporter MFP subunit
MKRFQYLINIAICLTVLTSCLQQSESDTKKEEKPVPVRVMKIESRHLPLVVESVGRLVANREVTLSAEVRGVVESYNADIGDRVENGQILVRVDQTDYRLALKEAEANLEVNQARLDAMEKSFERSRNLLTRNVISQNAFEKSEADFKSSRASVDHGKVLVDIAKERLNKTWISAPFSGLIASRMVEKGQTVGVGQPVMTLADLNPMRVRVYLTERDYVHLDWEDPVSVTIEASPESVFKGRIDRIGIKADERTNTFDVEILVENSDLFLKAGMTAKVQLTTAVIHDAIMIPQSAVLYRKDRKEVFVVGTNQKARVREIETGRSEGALIQIMKGLIPGDRLVVTGGQYLKPGNRVMIPSTEKDEVL